MKLLVGRRYLASLGWRSISGGDYFVHLGRGYVWKSFSSFAGREFRNGSNHKAAHVVAREDTSVAVEPVQSSGLVRICSSKRSRLFSCLPKDGDDAFGATIHAAKLEAGIIPAISHDVVSNGLSKLSGTKGWDSGGRWSRASVVDGTPKLPHFSYLQHGGVGGCSKSRGLSTLEARGSCSHDVSSDQAAGAASLDVNPSLESLRSSQQTTPDAKEDLDSTMKVEYGRSVSLRQEPVGLFGYDILKTAGGFHRFAAEAIQKSDDLIERIRLQPPSLETIRMLDDVSNTVCSIMDAAELCRNTHADREYVEAANQAFLRVSHYVQKLNMNRSLYNALVAAMDVGAAVTEEAQRVALTLRQDFERGGVHLAEEKRERVQQLNFHVTDLGMKFGQNVASDRSYVDVYPASSFQSLPASIHAMLTRVPGGESRVPGSGPFSGGSKKSWSPGSTDGVRVPTDPMVVRAVLKWVGDPEVRRQVYKAGYSSPAENLRVLDDLIAARHELAELLGFGSYAEFLTAPLMAKSPDTVVSFLEELSTCMRAKAEEDMDVLRLHKRSREQSGEVEIHAWDRAYYMGLAKSRAHNLSSAGTAAYFPLHRCLEGLGLLMRSLFSVELRDSPMAPGEAWAPDVFKLALAHPDEGELGHIYLDLYPRRGKYTHNAHFTVRCGRRSRDGGYQLPLVALVCNFARPLASSPSLLTHAEVETLFHEFGHALHSLLARTEYQHLSGTRASLDFVETPSNLLEYFAWDHRLLRQFARHHSTDEPIPEKLLSSLALSKSMFAASEMQTQVTYALMDQAFFGRQPMGGGSTTAVLAELQERHMGQRHVEGTHWQSRFTHLVGYGGGYYSYLYAKCFASQLWEAHFSADPLSRDAGEILWKGLLQSGGERDPASILKEVLGESGVLSTPGGGIRPCVAQVLREMGH